MGIRSVIALIFAIAVGSCTITPVGEATKADQVSFACRPDGTQRAVLTIDDWQVEESLVEFTDCRRSVDVNSPYWSVEIQLGKEGAGKFERITRASIGKKISIGVDGMERSAPKVQSPITGGVIRMFDNLSEADACALAARLARACEES